MKVVINRCFGGFGLSHEGILKYAEIKGITLYTCVGVDKSFDSKFKLATGKEKTNSLMGYAYLTESPDDDGGYAKDTYWSYRDIKRDDPALAQAVEELGEKADGTYAKLDVVEIPDGTKYNIDDYDGQESIHEVHRSW